MRPGERSSQEKSTWVGSLFAPSEIGAIVKDTGFVDVTFKTIEANFQLLLGHRAEACRLDLQTRAPAC